jgi:hypothetical protein
MTSDSETQRTDRPDAIGDSEYPRRVVLKFRADFKPTKDRLEPGDVPGWSGMLLEFPSLEPPRRRLPRGSLNAEAIERLVSIAKEHKGDFVPPPLEQYYVVDVPRGLDPEAPAAIARRLSRLPVVEEAYVEGRPLPPPSRGSCVPHQLHLKPAPVGIDAEYAWTHAGGKGEMQGLVDIEQGWGMINSPAGLVVAHADLNVPPIPLLAGLNEAFHAHGTRALGVVVAQRSAKGVIGITPNLQRVACVGQWRHARPGDRIDPINDLAEAISVAAVGMQRGDVLLLEAQTEFDELVNVPVESEPFTRDTISVVVGAGIVVIEAAGNGGVNVDALLSAMDPGAILVGAAEPASRQRTTHSNYGGRIHCYAWGEGVVTTDYHPFDKISAYTLPCGMGTPFAGTSSASAIVAGAALAVQGMAQATRGCRLTPDAVRTVLSDPANGTASAAGAQIGVMPDLRKIITRVIDTPVLNTFPCT